MLAGPRTRALGGVTIGLFAVQFLVLRPALNLRLDQRLAGVMLPPSRDHLLYIGLEVVKLLCLFGLGLAAALAAAPKPDAVAAAGPIADR